MFFSSAGHALQSVFTKWQSCRAYYINENGYLYKKRLSILCMETYGTPCIYTQMQKKLGEMLSTFWQLAV